MNFASVLTLPSPPSPYLSAANRSTDQRTQNTRVLHTNGLMRTSLTPDFSKLVICTNNGYLMVVHDVDFDTMQEDLRGFKVSLDGWHVHWN